jgi:hypothetical protein
MYKLHASGNATFFVARSQRVLSLGQSCSGLPSAIDSMKVFAFTL